MHSTSSALILLSICGDYVFPGNGPFRPNRVVSTCSSYTHTHTHIHTHIHTHTHTHIHS